MKRIQYENLMQKFFKIINEELEAETQEAKRVYKRIARAMFLEILRSNKNGK